MSFNGSGVFNRVYSWANDKTNGINITASRFDTEDGGFATGLSNCVCKDGQQTTTARIPFAVGLSVNQGAVGTPSISVVGDTSTGLYQISTGELKFASTGTLAATLNANGLDNTAIGQGTANIATFTTAAVGALTVSGLSALHAITGTSSTTLGANGGTGGSLVLKGATSGSCSVNVNAVAGTSTNFTLPTSNGTNTYILTTDGSGNTTWTAPSVAAAGALTLLATINAVGASTVVFSSTYITSTYNKYIIEFDGLFASGSTTFLLTVSTNNGSVYLNSGYQWGNSYVPFSTGSNTAAGNSSDSKINLYGGPAQSGTSLATSDQGTITFANPSASAPLQLTWQIAGAGIACELVGGGVGPGTTAINNIKIVPSGGTLTGNFHLYGISGT